MGRASKLRKELAYATAQQMTNEKPKNLASALKSIADDNHDKYKKMMIHFEEMPEDNPYYCKPSTKAEFAPGKDEGTEVLKIPIFGSFESNSEFKYDAKARHVYSNESIVTIIATLGLHDDRWIKMRERVNQLFFKGGLIREPHEKYIPEYENSEMSKRFIIRAISRVMESMHISHGRKIDAVAIMLTAWLLPE